MTVVAAVARDGHVTMAADTCTNYAGTDLCGAVKIRTLRWTSPSGPDAALIAASGNGALAAVAAREVRLSTDNGAVPDASNVAAVQSWADEIATAVAEVMAKQSPPILDENRIDGALLLGWSGHLFYLFTHQAARVPDGVAALGTGTDVALGAMHTALDAGASPESATTGAVLLACQLISGCRVDASGPLVRSWPEASDA